MEWRELFEYIIKPLSRSSRSDLVISASILAALSANEIKLPEGIAEHELTKNILASVSLDGSVRERALRILKEAENDEFREKLESFFKLIIETPLFDELVSRMSTNAGFLNVIRNALHSVNMIRLLPPEEIKGYLDRISSYLDEIEGFVAYYRVPKTVEEVVMDFRLPR